MKKWAVRLLVLSAAALTALTLCGCEKTAEWQRGESLGNGVYAVKTVSTDSPYSWYCTADEATGEILSVNIIYGDEAGQPTGIECTVGETSYEVTVSMGERDGGGVLFIYLPHELSLVSCSEKIKLLQRFGNGAAELIFRPSEVFSALEARDTV